MKYEEFGFHDKDITNIDKVIESIHELVGIKCDRYYTLLFSVLITMVTVLIELVY
jgi:anionic cell wall polymer biosynthesis LytR-Cps2A-Psr (LCP) family protein